ncbi:DNA-binding transcriptional regulator, AcrR family [Raineyella antarctica]|uniref:DNA-binding transcriptional regulator, AcrR family n=1 Tax=Raineyella antarctica TaxID=1577474 RepID=A0A1G6HN88_9ACTN|nr:TetR/AcrR family transcriptional regulator [Raineyella antarctica]SDB95664.1 DNA-binding transcriptional regulator, AcrR family [Raineyella antarctica]
MTTSPGSAAETGAAETGAVETGAVGGTAPTGDGRTARRLATRERLLDAALELFAERGYSATSMDDVADRAGVSKGTVFYNFGSKQALGLAVVQQAAARISAVADQARTPYAGWEALNATILAMLRAFDADPATCQVLFTELFRAERPWSDQLPAARATLVAPVATVIAEVHAERATAGRTTATPDAAQFEMIAVAVVGALVFSALDRATFHPGRSVEDVQAALMATISGLQA